MKRFFALILAVLMIAALFCACGEKTKTDSGSGDNSTVSEAAEEVKTTVDAKYDKGFAEQYAKSVTTDDSGNKVYEFDGEAYKNYTHDYNNTISAEITNDVAENHDVSFGQYCYINEERQAVIIGVNPGKYDAASAEKEASSIAQSAFPYFQGLAEPVDTIKVLYTNANDQNEVYGEFEFAVE